MRRRSPAALVLTAALLLVPAACGDDGADEETGTSTTTEAPAETTAGGDDGSTTTAADDGSNTTTTGADDGSTTTTADEGDLPGERIDIHPYEGAHLGVVGVAAGDTLNVRTGPGTTFDVVTELGPLSQEPTATGHNRTVDDGSLWVEVTVDDERSGWVNAAYVSQPGSVVDITDDVPAASGATAVEVAEVVAASRAPAEEGPEPTITVVAEPSEGDGGEEVTIDVIGLGDDAQEGERLIVVAALATGGTGYALVSVESIALCARGVADGLCV